MRDTFNNFILPCGIVLICALLWREISKMPPSQFDPLGAAFFPKMNLGVIMFCSALLLGNNIWRKRRGLPSAETLPEALNLTECLRMLGTLGMLLVYVLAIVYTDIHFIILTFVYLLVFGWFLAQWQWRDLPRLVLSAAIISAVIYGIFGMFLDIFFP